jgi:hypothetical protein
VEGFFLLRGLWVVFIGRGGRRSIDCISRMDGCGVVREIMEDHLVNRYEVGECGGYSRVNFRAYCPMAGPGCSSVSHYLVS